MSCKIDLENVAPSNWIDGASTVGDVERIVEFLSRQGTFNFPVLNNGLFPAAAATGEDFKASGYHNVWIRDNVQVAYAHFRVGRIDIAVRCVKSMAEFFSKHRFRLENVISGEADFSDAMVRPHIRFNGTSLSENSETWAHAQNDAIGYFLWLYGVLVANEHISRDEVDWYLISLFVQYLETIRYWEDEDSGHWEETRKIAASSIGPVVAALREWIQLATNEQVDVRAGITAKLMPLKLNRLEELHSCGRDALGKILPSECIQQEQSKTRCFDGALVFLCYPLAIVDRAMVDQILGDVARHLTGDFGIRRYQGDSYWCANYKDLLSADQRSSDFSDDLTARDQLLQPGSEAQWCIFDPAISCAYGERLANDFAAGQTVCDETLAKQVHHLQRSLSQLTNRLNPNGPFLCPESYFLHHGDWVPNDLTPLLWTQANLMQALWWLSNSLALLNRK